MMNVPAGTLPTANCPFMSVIAVCVLSPATTVTVAPMSGASLVASSTMPATVPLGLPLSTLTPCEQPPTATSSAHTNPMSFASSTSPLSFRQAKPCRPRSTALMRHGHADDGADDHRAADAADHPPKPLPPTKAPPVIFHVRPQPLVPLRLRRGRARPHAVEPHAVRTAPRASTRAVAGGRPRPSSRCD